MTRLPAGPMTTVLTALCLLGALDAQAARPVVAPPPAPASDPVPPPPPPPPVPAPVVAPPPAPGPAGECFPTCRTGYFCHLGQCVSACNPPCAASETCTPTGQCVSAGAPYAEPEARVEGRREAARPGYHYESHRRMGLLVGGIVPFAVGYAAAVTYGIYASTSTSSYLYAGSYNAFYGLPVLGPLLRQVAVTVSYGGSSYNSYNLYNAYTVGFDWVFTLLTSAAQGVGLTLGLLGLRTTDELVPDRVSSSHSGSTFHWAIAPGAPGAPAGLTLLIQN